MNNYLVYNLCDNNNNNYYGYTDNMKERWKGHKNNKKSKNQNCSSQKLDFDNTIITVIERGLSKEIAHIWEKFYIRNFECVNTYKYNFDRNEWHRKYSKEYREKHQEEIKKWAKTPWYCSLCDCNVRLGDKARHLKTKKHINNIK